MNEFLHLIRLDGPFLMPLLFVSGVNFFRYLVVAGIAFGFWYRGDKSVQLQGKLQNMLPTRRQMLRELGYSVLAALVFGLINGVLFGFNLMPHTQVYPKIADFGWGYFWLSIPLMMIVHDTYFYWMHRLIHQRRLFRHVHRVHHHSANPTPWAAYSFHPLESVLEGCAFIVIIFLMPVHFLALMIFETISILINVYGHLGYELYPANWQRHWFGRWINTSVAHNTHHATARHNYGLYFLFWDRLCGTLDPAYEERFDKARPPIAEANTGATAAMK